MQLHMYIYIYIGDLVARLETGLAEAIGDAKWAY